MAYGNFSGTGIGALLRLIQEQKSAQPSAPASSEPGSPIRNIIQQPIQLPESPGSTHVVSVKPEGTPPPSNQPVGAVIPPVSPVAPVAPVAPISPSASSSRPVPTPVPTPPQPQRNSPATANLAQGASAPSIATKISSPVYGPAVPSGFQYQSSAPKRLGQPVTGGLEGTPAPKQPSVNPFGPSSPLDPILRSIWDKLFKPTGGRAYA